MQQNQGQFLPFAVSCANQTLKISTNSRFLAWSWQCIWPEILDHKIANIGIRFMVLDYVVHYQRSV